MAVRSSAEETIVVAGPRDKWLARCKEALQKAGFAAIKVNPALNQVEGAFHKFTVWGEILLTLTPGARRRDAGADAAV